jgi:hypothetical protein
MQKGTVHDLPFSSSACMRCTTMPTTNFTWGYYGWGNATPQLVEAVDAVEMSRGFQPPIFVDIRIRRTVRAKGFQGAAFEKLLGPSRHRWMKTLGNKFIQTRTGPNIQIADPMAAEELLDLAMEAGQRKQRLLFFCSCHWPRRDGAIACHRATVAGLVLKAARARGLRMEIAEWPGGTPGFIKLDVTPKLLGAVKNGRRSIPLDNPNLGIDGGLPWGSIATLRAGDEEIHRLVGPALRQPKQWVLPVFETELEAEASLAAYERAAASLRRGLGLEPVSA